MPLDIRLATDFMDHPKTIKLIKRAGFEGYYCLTKLFAFARERKPDGHLAGMDGEDIEIASRWSGEAGVFFQALQDTHWIEKDENGVFAIHDWIEHQPYSAHQKERSEIARENAKRGWEKRRGQDISKPTECEPHANGKQSACEHQADGMQTLSSSSAPPPSPEEKNKDKEKRKDNGAPAPSSAAREEVCRDGSPVVARIETAGNVLRISEKQSQAWQKTFSTLDVNAELVRLETWARDAPPGELWDGKGAFKACCNYLANRHGKNVAAAKRPRPRDAEPEWMRAL